jgi:malonate transporter and related proteins
MISVLSIVTPVFALMALGYLAARLKYLPESAGGALSQFAFKVAIPVMLFRAMLTAPPLAGSPWRMLAAYLVMISVLWVAATLVAAYALHKPADDHAAFAMSSTFGNTVMLGIPISVMAFGQEATTLLAILIAVEATLLWIVATLHMEIARRGRAMSLGALGGVVRDLAANPIILSLVFGLAGRVAGLSLPEMPDRMLQLLGQAGVPTALFALGMVLSTFKLGGEKVTLVAIGMLKLFAMPLAAYVLAQHVFALPPLFVAVLVMHCAMPVGANPFLFATRYDRSPATISASIVASTLVAVVTVSGLLVALGARMKQASSIVGAKGTGMRGEARRLMRTPGACSATVAATSAPKPEVPTPSCTTSRRPVWRAEASTASLSQGHSVRRSRRSMPMPSSANASAAAMATGMACAQLTIVTSWPARTCAALPNGMAGHASGRSACVLNSAFGSKKTTGSSLRTALRNRPARSSAFDGAATTSPGTLTNQPSMTWLCWAAEPGCSPCGTRTTTLARACPPNM